jgi:hypothetical protein
MRSQDETKGTTGARFRDLTPKPPTDYSKIQRYRVLQSQLVRPIGGVRLFFSICIADSAKFPQDGMERATYWNHS